MKRPLKAYPILASDDNALEVAEWNSWHPDQSITITDEVSAAHVYLFTGLAADEADERLSAGLNAEGWTDRPVIWLAAGASFYASVSAFESVNPTDLDGVLRQVYGVVPRERLIDLLHEVERALDDAASVVAAGDAEEVAYEHELRDVRSLLGQLERGAFIAEGG